MQEIRPGYVGTAPVTPNTKERIGKLRSSLWSFVKYSLQAMLVAGVFFFLLRGCFEIYLEAIGGGMKVGARGFHWALLEDEEKFDAQPRRQHHPQKTAVVPVANVKTVPTSSAKANKPKR